MVELWAVYRVNLESRIYVYEKSFISEQEAKHYIESSSGGTFLIECFYHVSMKPS